MLEKSPSIAIADSIWKNIESTSSVTDEQLSILHFLFGKNFERATRIVDQRGVKRISGAPSGRSIFQMENAASASTKCRVVVNIDGPMACGGIVMLCWEDSCVVWSCDPNQSKIWAAHKVVGESRRKEEYFCFPEHYCACYSFFYDIVNRGEQLCCKHQLAARLASSLGVYTEVKVSDEELAMLLATF